MKCLDTFVLVEIARGNNRFTRYFDEEIVIPNEILAEFFGVILRDKNELTANYWIKKLEGYGKEVPLNILIKAIKFKYKNTTKNFSFFDCVGYIFALENNMQFVTGDGEFKNMKNVEFTES